MDANRRRHPRVPLFSLVDVRTDDCDEFFSEMGVNVSVGGMFLETTAHYPLGAFLELQFAADESTPVIEGVGRVMYRSPAHKDGAAPGIGVRFLHMVEPSLTHVHDVVRSRAHLTLPD